MRISWYSNISKVARELVSSFSFKTIVHLGSEYGVMAPNGHDFHFFLTNDLITFSPSFQPHNMPLDANKPGQGAILTSATKS